MERKQYLDLCQQQAVRGGMIVTYNGGKYNPVAYQLSFLSDGKVRHTAIIKDARANCLVYCALDKINL